MLNSNFFLIMMSLFLAMVLGNKLLTLKAISLVLFIFFGILMWPSEVPETSELGNYYFPLFDIEASWNPFVYMGGPLLFQFVAGVKNMVDISNEGVIVITRLLFIILTTLAVRRLYVAMFDQAALSNCPSRHAKHLSVNINAHMAGIFFLLDYTFSYLIAGDQLKQLIGMPFSILAVVFLLEKRIWLFLLFSFLSILSHYLFVAVFLIVCLSKSTVRWRLFRRRYSLALLPLGAFFSVVIVKSFLAGMNFIGDKVNHPVPSGLLDGLLMRPGAIIALIFYLFFILSFCIYAKEDFKNPRLKFILMLVALLFGFSKVNILGIQFVEPARIYSLIAPFFAILVTRVYLLSRTSFDRLMLICAIVLYNFMYIQVGEANNHLISLLSRSVFEIYERNLNQEFILTLVAVGIIFVIPLLKTLLLFRLPSYSIGMHPSVRKT